MINKIILQPDTVYEHVQYQFEEDAFDTVPDLITYYVGSGKPITAASGARIQFPKNRMYPLSFYAAKYPTPLPQSRLTSPSTPSMQFARFVTTIPGKNLRDFNFICLAEWEWAEGILVQHEGLQDCLLRNNEVKVLPLPKS